MQRLADAIVAKKSEGTDWLMQLLLASILADANVAKTFEGIAWLMQFLQRNLEEWTESVIICEESQCEQ